MRLTFPEYPIHIDYETVAINYDSWSVSFACSGNAFVHSETMWTFTRERNPKNLDAIRNEIYQALDKIGLTKSRKFMNTRVNQTNCNN